MTEGKHREALPKFEESLSLDSSFDPHWRTADCRRAAGDSRLAEERLWPVLVKFPDHAAIVDLWFLLAKLDRKQTAAESLKLLAPQDPTSKPSTSGPLRYSSEALLASQPTGLCVRNLASLIAWDGGSRFLPRPLCSSREQRKLGPKLTS